MRAHWEDKVKNKGILKLAESGNVSKALKKASKKAKKATTGSLPFGLDFLKEFDFDLDELGSAGKMARRYIKKHPAQAVIFGAAIGFYLGVTTKELLPGVNKEAA